MKYLRVLQLTNLMQKKSHFLFGPRATGKSFLIREQFQDKHPIINLLKNDVFMELNTNPSRLESIILAHPNPEFTIIDEVQMIPPLLNEVHRLIEERNWRFLLTGSSARKLKQKNTNLLAGRARTAELFPLTHQEIDNFDLQRYLQIGGLPSIYLSDEPELDLAAYTQTYLKDEIQQEALTRNIPGFTRFLQSAAITSGRMLNFTAMASDTGVPATTIREYYHILEDTFLGFMLNPFTKTQKRKAISTAKFYLFDIGVKNHLAGHHYIPKKSELFGDVFEHFIGLELRAYLSYRRSLLPLSYWRSKSGFEVDFLIGDEIAIEVKSTERINQNDFKGLNAFKEENIAKHFIIVSQDPIAKNIDGILCLPWQTFLQHLWQDEFLHKP